MDQSEFQTAEANGETPVIIGLTDLSDSDMEAPSATYDIHVRSLNPLVPGTCIVSSASGAEPLLGNAEHLAEPATPDISLFTASLTGDLDAVKSLVEEEQAHVNFALPQAGHATVLLAACRNSHVSVARYLLCKGAEANAADDSGATPLMEATYRNNPGMCKLLLENTDVDVNRVNHVTGRCPLHHAAANGYVDVADLLLQHGDIDINKQTRNGKTPLYLACHKDRHDVVVRLLERGADVNIPCSNSQRTAFGKACEHGSLQVFEEFLKVPTLNVNHRDNLGCMPLHRAVLGDHGNVARLLMEKTAADPNLPDEGGYSPLITACSYGSSRLCRLLLGDERVDVSAAGKDGMTALHWACACTEDDDEGEGDLVQLLVDRGADVNADTVTGLSPLHLACMNGNLPAACALCDSWADVMHVDQANHTAFDHLSLAGLDPELSRYIHSTLVVAAYRQVPEE